MLQAASHLPQVLPSRLPRDSRQQEASRPPHLPTEARGHREGQRGPGQGDMDPACPSFPGHQEDGSRQAAPLAEMFPGLQL